MDGVCASQHHGAAVHLQAAVAMLQVGADAVECPGTLCLIVDNLQTAVGRVGKGTRVGRIAGFLVGEGGAAAVVSHQGILGQGIDGEACPGRIRCLGSGVPVHAVAVHIQRAATVAEGQVALDLLRIADNHRSPGIHQHIVGCIAPLPVQVGLAAAAQVQQHIIIPAAFDIQIARANLAPLPHILRRIGELHVYLGSLIDDIARMVEQIALSLGRGNGKLPATELCIADTQIHRIIQHNAVLFCRGIEHQVLREEQVLITLRHIGLSVSIPILRIFQPAQVRPGVQPGFKPDERNRLHSFPCHSSQPFCRAASPIIRYRLTLGAHCVQVHLTHRPHVHLLRVALLNHLFIKSRIYNKS